MHYGLVSRSGNVLEWFDDEGAARSALDSMGDGVDLVAFDESGRPTDAIHTLYWSYQALSATATQGAFAEVVLRSPSFPDVGLNDSLATIRNKPEIPVA